MKKLKLQFGGKVTPELKATYEKSSNWKDGKFENLEETSMSLSFWDISELLYKQFCSKENRVPENPIPIVPFDKDQFLDESKEVKFIWYGHSAILMRNAGKTILIDPMLGPNASPIAPYKTARFSEGSLDVIDAFPPIDLIMLSHDHYDHLDLDSIMKLKEKTTRFCVALGVKRHLVKWGVRADHIQEFDWWDTANFDGIDVTLTPTRHFSGRGITDRAKSLWGGWVFKSSKHNIWFSGDGGYGKHFKEIGERLGPFDFGFMECGQYNEKWRPIHMFPDEAVQAAIDAHVKFSMPVHWCGFALSQHSWTEPVEEYLKHAKKINHSAIFPRIGQLVDLEQGLKFEAWWKTHT